MDNSYDEQFADVNGGIPVSEIFRPVNNKFTISTEDGEMWKQVTGTGFRRVSDQYFWPCDPRNATNFLGQMPPSVLAALRQRKGLS